MKIIHRYPYIYIYLHKLCFRFYLQCLLPEIVDPLFKYRQMVSDIREPEKNIVKKAVKIKLF